MCGKEFEARGRSLTCSSECSKINKRNKAKEYKRSEEGKAANKRYWESDKGKATMKRYEQSEKGKVTRKKYKQSEKGKAVAKKAVKKYQQTDKGKAVKKKADKKYRESDKGKATMKKAQKKYRENNRDKIRESQKKYNQSEKGKATRKRFRENNPGYELKYTKKYIKKKISELNEKYDGDLDLVLKDCPNMWLVREAIMQVEFGVSYADAMYQKMQANPVCEVTGRKDNLVIHHLDSFNTHPEKGADLDNLVVITKEIHKIFHDQFGWGNNTREQWFEFLEKNRNIYI